MRRFLTFLLFTGLSLSASAAQDVTVVKGGQPGTNVDMPYLMAPLTGSEGKLIGYAYISSRLTAVSEPVARDDVRAKLPFIQDVFVRDVNGRTVSTAGDPEQVDLASLESRLLTDAVKVMGSNKVKVITICTVEIAELHADKTQALNGPAEPAALDSHGNPQKTRCAPEKPA
jgi:hypothetical protein